MSWMCYLCTCFVCLRLHQPGLLLKEVALHPSCPQDGATLLSSCFWLSVATQTSWGTRAAAQAHEKSRESQLRNGKSVCFSIGDARAGCSVVWACGQVHQGSDQAPCSPLLPCSVGMACRVPPDRKLSIWICQLHCMCNCSMTLFSQNGLKYLKHWKNSALTTLNHRQTWLHLERAWVLLEGPQLFEEL